MTLKRNTAVPITFLCLFVRQAYGFINSVTRPRKTPSVSNSINLVLPWQSRPRLSHDESSLNLIGTIDAFMQAAPYATAFIAGGIESSAADFVAQIQEQQSLRLFSNMKGRQQYLDGLKRKTQIDWKRNISFLLYGGLCLGIAYEWIYNVLFPKMFGASTNLPSALGMTIFECFVISPFLSIPFSYLISAAISRKSFRKAIRNYWRDATKNGLLTTYCAFFGPFQVALFVFVPAHLRMTVTSAVSFIWCIVLSKAAAKA